MKNYILIIALFISGNLLAQEFDYYGPQPFDQILENTFNQPWTPQPLSSIENRKYMVILDEATKSTAIQQNTSDITAVSMTDLMNVNGASSTYKSMLSSIFQIVDINTHEDNNTVALAGQYRLNPFLHSYYALNSASDNSTNITDGGTLFIDEETETGYVLVEFTGTASSATIKAVSQWEYDPGTGEIKENTSWTDKYLQIVGSALSWTETGAEATSFYLADANDLIALEIAEGSDFDPLSVEYQPNATAELPEVNPLEDSPVINDIEIDLDPDLAGQLGISADATAAVTTKLDEIETTLTDAGASLRYPKEFYLAVRESMLSQVIASTDVYGIRLDYNTIPHVYFTNAPDDDGVPHPFMVIASHAVSTRPNQLVDVSRPPGAEAGVGYGESTVTRNGKPGEFLVKIPLKDYGLIDNLLDNEIVKGDLASDFDNMHGTTTTKDVYNYTSTSSIGMAIDGVTIYPGQNNNLRFAVEDGEVTHSGIHVGAGLELHYHADGHGFSSNGIALYNLADYEGHDHPPVIGMAYDGIALFGKYEDDYSSMVGYSIAVDEYGGHDHGDGFGYHYHAHRLNVESSMGSTFDENFLLVGAWKGKINDIPGFEEGKMDQFKNDEISRYVSGTSDTTSPPPGEEVTGISSSETVNFIVYPNPAKSSLNIVTDDVYFVKIFDHQGKMVKKFKTDESDQLSIDNLSPGLYIIMAEGKEEMLSFKIIIE